MREKLLLAFIGLFLTQAIFAVDFAADENSKKTPLGKYGSLLNSVAGKVSSRVEKIVGDLFSLDNKNDVARTLHVEDEPSSAKSNLDNAEASPAAVDVKPSVPSGYRSTLMKERKKRQRMRRGREVRSFKVSGNDVSLSNSEHSRKKRSVGVIPDEFEFTLSALSPFDVVDPTFKIGDVIPYKLVVLANNQQTDVKVEIFSQLEGGAYFMVSNVQIGAVGSNFDDTFSADNVTIRYYSTFQDGRWDYVTVDLGDVINDASDSSSEAESQIEILFDVQALPHDGYVVDSLYRVSVGAMYQSESFVSVAQDDLKYAMYTTQTPPDATFSISGPSTLNLGTTGVWNITASIYDLYSDIAVDVLAPLHQPGIMTIDRISVRSVGSNYDHSAIAFDDGGNFSRFTYENYGDYGRLNLGKIVNKGYHSSDSDPDRNSITFEVSITMLDHDYNDTDPYTVGFTVWKKDQDSIEIMWSVQESVQAVNTTLPSLSASPVFHWGPSIGSVVFGGRFALLVNMSIPAGTSAAYVFEASVPVNDSKAMMQIENVRMSRVGFNMPHVNAWLEDNGISYSIETTGSAVEFISWDLGVITNTAQRSGSDDDILQFEVTIKMLDVVEQYYEPGQDLPISIGVKHAEDYYWVGRTSVSYPANNTIQYSSDKVPEFSFTNVMGADAMIYPDSAAVFDLDMVLPPGVDYALFSMEISTTNFTSDASMLKIISMEVVHIGKAVYLDNVQPANLTSFADEKDSAGRLIYTTAELKIDRVTSLRDESFPRYEFEDNTVRIRTVVIARGDKDAGLVDAETYWTEATVNFADSYIYAARAGVIYNDTIPNMYATPADNTYVWQPIMTFNIKEGGTPIVAKGQPVFYNVTFGVPYRTVSDLYVQMQTTNPELQVCRLTYLSHGSAIVDYDSAKYDGDLLNSTTSHNIDTASNYKHMVTSFDYGYFVDDVRDSYVSYEAIVMLNNDAVLGSNYTFTADMKMADGAATTSPNPYVLELSTSDVPAALTTLPEVFLGKITNTTETINFGGSEVYYLDIYIPPGTQHHLFINFFAPWNDTFYGDYEILETYISYVGENLACYEHTRTQINVTKSSDNTEEDNLAIINLGYLPSISPDGSDEVMIEANKIRIMSHVAISSNSTLTVGQLIPVAATIDIDGEHMWVGYIESEVVAFDDSGNNQAIGDVELHLYALEDNVYNVGEIQDYEGLLVLPSGSAYANFTINLESQIDISGGRSESRVKIYDVAFMRAGVNMLELERDYQIISTENSYGVQHIQQIDFKFVRNSDLSTISNFLEPIENITESGENQNEFLFKFKIQMLDTHELVNGFKFNISATVKTGSTVLTTAVNDTEITIESDAANDKAVLVWNVSLVERPDEILQTSTLVFDMSIYLDEPPTSRRFATEVIIHYRVPAFSQLESVYNVTTIDHQFTRPTAVDAKGLEFKWTRIRWENFNYLRFNLTVDPDFNLAPGLGNRTITVPIDVSFKTEIRATPATYNAWFTDMRVLSFPVFVPENFPSLGMGDPSKIKDCQISASSDDGINVAANARPTSDGWSTVMNAGPPLYRNQYIQVDFPAKMKFTAITIYPFNDITPSRITEFKVQHSRKGIRWVYALDEQLEAKTYTVDWPMGVTANSSEFIKLGNSEFVAQHIRILPQANAENLYTSKLRFELHGYPWPVGSTLPAYTCPTPVSSAGLQSYVDRHILVVPGTEQLYACTVPSVGEMPYCSGTDNFGKSWFAMDDNVLNMKVHDAKTSALYALARDRKTYLMSVDNGHKWRAISNSRYADMESAGTLTLAKEIPFPLEGANLAEVFDNYGTEVDAGHSWTVSEKALHAHPVDGATAKTKTDTEGQVAFWGDKEWSGP